MRHSAMWPRWLALSLLGLPLTIGIVGVLALATPGPASISALPWMLLVFPVWTGVMVLPFVFSSGRRAWVWLGLATVTSLGLLYGLKALGWLKVAA